MMVLGGPDQQPTSPTQMLGMYPSYSGGFGSQSSVGPPFRSRSGPQSENPMRSMSSGSFGGPSSSYTNKMSIAVAVDASPHSSYHQPPPPISHEQSRSSDGTPTFYNFLGQHKGAFIRCKFLLPGLKQAMLESPHMSDSKKGVIEDSNTTPSAGNKRNLKRSGSGASTSLPHNNSNLSRRSNYIEPSPQDIAVAVRRVTSAICAFGGGMSGDRGVSTSDKSKEASTTTATSSTNKSGSSSSIFREKDDGSKAATVTPSSSAGTPPGNRSRPKMKYDEILPTRYYENENRLSWEFEEFPPVENMVNNSGSGKGDGGSGKGGGAGKDGQDRKSGDGYGRDLSSPTPNQKPNAVPSDPNSKSKIGSPPDQPKMRYRCKLCGQPKQNHICPFTHSLQRNIGIMVYPAVNAFTASEPGKLAPALADMNNFISTGSESHSSAESSPSRPTPDRPHKSSLAPGKTPNVTPETMRSANSPDGSNTSGSPFRSPSGRKSRVNSPAVSTISASHNSGSVSRKRSHSQMDNTNSGGTGSGKPGSHDDDLLFVETADLMPEQFRSVTAPKKGRQLDNYTYPALPLPYAQRKRLSDNLFSLSKEVPQLTDECAVVLREAREKDMWDLAVAELMTQVVVVIHCREGDSRFEGLRHYLLTLGIAC